MRRQPTYLERNWLPHLVSEILGLKTPRQVWDAYLADCGGKLTLLRWHSLAFRTALADQIS